MRELSFGVVRWHSLLDWHIKRHLHRRHGRLAPLVRQHLRLAAYQILFLERVPPSAAVNEAVKAIKHSSERRAAGLVNALLRRLAAEGYEAPSPKNSLALETSHPEWMVERWLRRYGPDGARRVCDANNTMAPLTLRTNTLQLSRAELIEALSKKGIPAEPGIYSPEAVVLRQWRGLPTRLPGFREGWFQVQDEAAQIVAHCVTPQPGERVLDACAGLGGKATHLAQIMKDTGSVVASDPHAGRLARLRDNCKRLGLRSVGVLPYETLREHILAAHPRYHRVLVDAPCSGLGVIRRHPDIKWNRRPDDIRALAARQAKLLSEIAPLLQSRGCLVYATCTLEPEETCDVVKGFLKTHPTWEIRSVQDLLPSSARTMADDSGFMVSMPTPNGPDGFFAAVLAKKMRHTRSFPSGNPKRSVS